MKSIGVYSFHRSGTNMFASYMNHHKKIHSINSGGGSSRWANINNYKSRSLYNDLQIEKDLDYIDYVLVDEIKINQESDRKIALIRDLDSINSSIKSLKNKINWNVPYVSKASHNDLINLAKDPDVLGIYTETFVLHTKEVLKQVCNWLGIDYFEGMEDPHKCIKNCMCGKKFSNLETDQYEGSAGNPKNFYYCESCNKILVGGGGFNPNEIIDKNRVKDPENRSIEKMNIDLNNKI